MDQEDVGVFALGQCESLLTGLFGQGEKSVGKRIVCISMGVSFPWLYRHQHTEQSRIRRKGRPEHSWCTSGSPVAWTVSFR